MRRQLPLQAAQLGASSQLISCLPLGAGAAWEGWAAWTPRPARAQGKSSRGSMGAPDSREEMEGAHHSWLLGFPVRRLPSREGSEGVALTLV